MPLTFPWSYLSRAWRWDCVWHTMCAAPAAGCRGGVWGAGRVCACAECKSPRIAEEAAGGGLWIVELGRKLGRLRKSRPHGG